MCYTTEKSGNVRVETCPLDSALCQSLVTLGRTASEKWWGRRNLIGGDCGVSRKLESVANFSNWEEERI